MIRAFWFALFLLPAVLSGVKAQDPRALGAALVPASAIIVPPSGGPSWGAPVVLGTVSSASRTLTYTNTGSTFAVLFTCAGTDVPGTMPSAVTNSCAPAVQRGGFVTPGMPGSMTASPEPDYTVAAGASGVATWTGSRSSPARGVFMRPYTP
jgi:hypothetical protein